MIRSASVLFFCCVCIGLGMMPTLAANGFSVGKVSGDGQKMTVSKLPATFPNALTAKFVMPNDAIFGVGKTTSLDWSIDPTNNSAKCQITTLMKSTFQVGTSSVTVTAFAPGTCVVNVTGPQDSHESFSLAVTQVAATPAPTLPYSAKIMFGNSQTVVWPANSSIQNGDNAYLTAMEVQLFDRAGNPAPNVEVDWECTTPGAMHCQMKLPMIMGILGKIGELTITDPSGKADLPAFVLAPNGAQSPLVVNNGRGTFTVTADSPKGLFAPVVFTMTVK